MDSFAQGQGLGVDVRLLAIRVDDDLVIVLPEFAAEKPIRMDVGCIASIVGDGVVHPHDCTAVSVKDGGGEQ